MAYNFEEFVEDAAFSLAAPRNEEPGEREAYNEWSKRFDLARKRVSEQHLATLREAKEAPSNPQLPAN
jgi:hypothetical protein